MQRTRQTADLIVYLSVHNISRCLVSVVMLNAYLVLSHMYRCLQVRTRGQRHRRTFHFSSLTFLSLVLYSLAASVEVLTDNDITNATATLPGISYDINMHGVAEPRGEHLLATLRRDDAQSTSNAKILPDQVGVYHFHDGEYELEQMKDVWMAKLSLSSAV